jgi:hypothetical protein
MKNTIRPAKENLILGGKGLFILGAILFTTGLILNMSTMGILFSMAGFVVMASGLLS